jgi:hypothetical protein
MNGSTAKREVIHIPSNRKKNYKIMREFHENK